MAISWGAYDNGGTNGMRVGLDYSWSNPSSSSSSVKLTVRVYTQNRYAYSDNQVLTYTGSAGSGSTSYNNTSSGGAVLRATRTYTYSYPSGSYGTSPGTRTFTARVSGAYNGVTPYKTITTRIPARPQAGPAAPTGLSATRVSDKTADLSWTNHSTTAAPYSSIRVDRAHWTGTAWTARYTVATLTGSARTYRDSTISADGAYIWYLIARNSSGSSSLAGMSPGLNTTPAAPTDVTSAISPSGASIVTSWSAKVYGSTTSPLNRSFIIERSVNGGGWSQVASGVQSPWTDNSPGAGSNTYRVRTLSGYSLPLTSAWATGNTVSTIVAPLAPSNLAPSGGAADLWNEGVTLSWRHNHGGDGVAQTRAEVRWSDDYGVTWSTLVDQSSSEQSAPFPPGVAADGGPGILWQVRTYGVASEGPSPWSPFGTIFPRARPVVAMTGPGESVNTGLVTASWTYSLPDSPDAQSPSPQVGWEAVLADIDGNELQSVVGYDAATSLTFSQRLEDSTPYRVSVRAQSSNGLWSAWVSRSFVAEFPSPAAIFTVPEWQPLTGTVLLRMTPATPLPAGDDPDSLPADTLLPSDELYPSDGGVPAEDEAIAATIERRIDGGDWVTLAGNLPMPNDFIDPLPSLAGVNEYRITSISYMPTYRVNPVTTVETPSGDIGGDSQPLPPWGWIKWAMLSYGPGWGTTLRFAGEPEVSATVARTSEAHAFLGRRKPVGSWGENRSRTLSVGGTLLYGPRVAPQPEASLPMEWEDAGQDATLVCYRDMHGRRIFGKLGGDVSVKPTTDGMSEVSFEVVELDYVEEYGDPVDNDGETVEDFHIRFLDSDTFEVWGFSVTEDSTSGSWTATSALITDFNNGYWSADETE